MLYGIIIAVCSLIYLIILNIIYYSKQRIEGVRGILYRFMLVSCMIFMIFQILLTLVTYYRMDNIWMFITLRASWSANIAWYAMFYFYFIVFINNDESKTFFEFLNSRKSCKITAICFVIGIICYIFLVPFVREAGEYMNYFPGKFFAVAFILSLIIDVMVIIGLVKNISKVSRPNRMVIYLSIFLTIILSYIQLKFRSIAVIPIGYAIEMYLLYFTIENPDLILLSNTKKVRDEVEKANKVKLDFLSNISYEIKNPMDSISSLTDTLLNTQFNKDSAKNYLKQICNSGTDLLDITNNVLDLSAIETGSNALKNKNYNISEMIYRVVDVIKNKLGFSKINFNVSIDTNMPSILYGDETKIYQCVLNVLVNAVKYTEIGKINFSVLSQREGENVRLLFKVMDTGIGIKESDSKYLFEKFSRLEDAKTREIEGSGLGLTICKKYLELMGGKIWFESQHLAGSTFYIEVVQKIVDPTPVRNIKFNTERINYGDGLDCSNFKLLVVEDNELNIKVLSRLLERYKLKFDAINDGDKCISKIKAEEKYDLIFMDDSLPVLSGTETLKIIKELAHDNLPPVVALTANSILGMREQYLSEGFDDYLSKPIDMQELDRIINKYLKK